MSRDLTDEEFVQRLVDNGWSREDAEAELSQLDDDCAEAGYDGP